MLASLLPLLYPIASFLLTDAIKGISERYSLNWHPVASVGTAATIGAGLTQVVQTPDMTAILTQMAPILKSPEMASCLAVIKNAMAVSPWTGAILGMAAAAVHDLITPPSAPVAPPAKPAA